MATAKVWKLDEDQRKIRGNIDRESRNTPIQGSGAAMTKLALIYVRDYIIENNLTNCHLVSTVHDRFCRG